MDMRIDQIQTYFFIPIYVEAPSQNYVHPRTVIGNQLLKQMATKLDEPSQDIDGDSYA